MITVASHSEVVRINKWASTHDVCKCTWEYRCIDCYINSDDFINDLTAAIVSDQEFSDEEFSDQEFSDKEFSDQEFSDEEFSDQEFSDQGDDIIMIEEPTFTYMCAQN